MVVEDKEEDEDEEDDAGQKAVGSLGECHGVYMERTGQPGGRYNPHSCQQTWIKGMLRRQ
ncbi:hypothetical protein E2C01_043057 [Portunus trituberculatus]|uniref:Uncharacterized protein n=1 Tax=Portunus trituberculatus TaxID=210409 RepID=A0A5B7FVB3_PORTR|nr:hypothetical protein [Portunus trituberculatus]